MFIKFGRILSLNATNVLVNIFCPPNYVFDLILWNFWFVALRVLRLKFVRLIAGVFKNKNIPPKLLKILRGIASNKPRWLMKKHLSKNSMFNFSIIFRLNQLIKLTILYQFDWCIYFKRYTISDKRDAVTQGYRDSFIYIPIDRFSNSLNNIDQFISNT